jgi:hypothetical protein
VTSSDVPERLIHVRLPGPLRATATVLATALAAGMATSPVAAQTDRPWKYDAEFGASVFFGASQQTAVLIRNRLDWSEDRLEFSAAGGFDYGEAKDRDGDRFVSKRSWIVETSGDYLPGGRASPFIFATAEGSYERQIDLRTSGGAGAKYRFIDSERTRLDASLAALLERTDPRARAGVEQDVASIGRWSARLRARRALAEAVEVQLITFFRPNMSDFDDHTWDLTASMQYALSDLLGLRVSLVNRYDSMAENRGARANYDGRLFFSALASIR